MVSHITLFPPEILHNIYEHTMTAAGPAPGETPAGLSHAYVAREEAARQVRKDRGNWMQVNRIFRDTATKNLSLKRNAEAGCIATKSAVSGLARGTDLNKFRKRIGALFARHSNIEVDLSKVSSDQAKLLLEVLEQRAHEGATPLHNVRFTVDLDVAPKDQPELVDQTITAVRASENGQDVRFEFTCGSHDRKRTSVDLIPCRNLTSVDSSECNSLEKPPDFSHYPELKSVYLGGCHSLRTTPVFLANSKLEQVDLSSCELLLAPPDFSRNPNLIWVDLSECFGLETTPDFSSNPKLSWVEMEDCGNLPPPIFPPHLQMTEWETSCWKTLDSAGGQ